jgi:hypothetical protein
MQTFYPWGKENFGILLDQNLLDRLKKLSYQAQIYYTGIEKNRNGSSSEIQPFLDMKDEIIVQIDQISEQVKRQEQGYALILENVLMKQSLAAALLAHTLDFDYRILQANIVNGKWELMGVIRDRSGNRIESSGQSEIGDSTDPAQFLGAFQTASKKAFISAVSQMSELDLITKTSEALI